MIDFVEENHEIQAARAFVLKKWQQRHSEKWGDQNKSLPTDLSSACKFASMFSQKVFGGAIRGNEFHQYLLNREGQIIDLCRFSENVRTLVADGKDPWSHDPAFFGNPDHMASMRSCQKRVDEWFAEWQLEVSNISTTSNEKFHKSNIGVGEINRRSRELMNLMHHVMEIQKAFKAGRHVQGIKLLTSAPSPLSPNMPIPYPAYLKNVEARGMVEREIKRLTQVLGQAKDELIFKSVSSWEKSEKIIFGQQNKTVNSPENMQDADINLGM